MSGDSVRLPGPDVDALIGSMSALARTEPVLIGWLAVMSRVMGVHRPTADADTAYNNDTEIPTTEMLVSSGVAEKGDAPQRVTIGSVIVDVIDTFAIDERQLPDEPASRLFVCGHRWAYESATPMTLVGDSQTAIVRVATPEALIAMKAHALRHARAGRRANKRKSDLVDVVTLAMTTTGPVLADAPWSLAGQVRAALREDLTDTAADLATLHGTGSPGMDALELSSLQRIVDGLLVRLGHDPAPTRT